MSYRRLPTDESKLWLFRKTDPRLAPVVITADEPRVNIEDTRVSPILQDNGSAEAIWAQRMAWWLHPHPPQPQRP